MSRRALVKHTPGTRAMSAPMVIRSGSRAGHTLEQAMARKADTALAAMVLKKELAPIRPMRCRLRPMDRQHSPLSTDSAQFPPKNRQKPKAPTK